MILHSLGAATEKALFVTVHCASAKGRESQRKTLEEDVSEQGLRPTCSRAG